MRNKIGDSNFTERNSRRSADGVFGVECARLGSDLKSAADENSRRTGCGVVLGDQIPMQTRKIQKNLINMTLLQHISMWLKPTKGKEHANDYENWLELSTGLEWISKISNTQKLYNYR